MKRLLLSVPVLFFLVWYCADAKGLGSGCPNFPVLPPLNVTGIVLQDTCNLGHGSIDVTVSGGVPPYTYLWDDGATAEDATNLMAGPHWVFVVDAVGASQYGNFFVNNFTDIWYANAYYYHSVIYYPNTACTGPPNGGWDFTPLTSLPFIWNWSNGVTTADNLGLSAGNYYLSISLGTCVLTDVQYQLQNNFDSPELNASPTNATCDLPNGSIDLSVTESEPPYTYAWSNGASTEDLSNLAPGTYTVTVTGANGCTEDGNWVIGDVIPFSVTGMPIAASSCLVPNGAVNLTPSPPGSYTYAWSNGANTEDISGLSAGSYLVTVTDGNGCTATNSFTVDDTATPPTLAATASPATCGQNNGGVNLTPSGGASPYTFAWSNGPTTEDLANVPPGSYAVTVTGANGCTATASATVPDDPININITGTTTPAPNGSVNITASPTNGYTYTWSNGANTEDIGGLAAGTYTVTVSLGMGCTASASFEVEGLNPPPISITGITYNDTCNLNYGAIDITVTGGTPPYTYAWSNGAITEDIANLPGGTYMVTVQDAVGTISIADFTVVNLVDIFFGSNFNYYYNDFHAYNNTVCIGPPNGGFEWTTLTTLPFVWNWSNGVNTPYNLNLPSGFYYLTITIGTCVIPWAPFHVSDNPDAPVLAPAIEDATCALPNGSIDLTVTESEPPYTYAWSNGANSEDISDLVPGTYTVTVTGSNGCTEEGSYMIEDVPAFTTSGTSTPASSCISANGAVNLTPFPPGSYTYAWSNGASTEDISGLSAGSYLVTVTDPDGCTDTNSFTVDDTATPPTLAATASPANCGQNNGGVNLTPSGGATPYAFAWSNGANTEDLTGVPGGSYAVTVTGANGCTATASATVPDDDINIAIMGTVVPNTACTGSNGSITTSVSPAAPPSGSYTYTWGNGPTTPSLGALPGGSYSLTVSVGTCTATASFVVADQPAVPTLGTSALPATCGLPSGSADLTVVGGAMPFAYEWSNGATGEDLSGVPAGSYTVTVTSVGTGCTASATALVGNEDLPITVPGTAMPNTSCTAPNGSVDISPTPSPPPTGSYSFAWSNGATTEDIGSLGTGSYTVTVSLGPNCAEAATFTVGSGPQLPNLSLSTTPANCGGMGSVNLTVSGGTSPYGFLWSNTATTEDLPSVNAGSYTVTVTGADGCSATASIAVPNNGGGADTTTIAATTCDPGDVGIFTQDLTGQDGCDSVVVTTVSLLASDTTAVFGTSCDLNDVGIFQQTLTNGNGCDSLIITTIAYFASDTTAVYGTSCDLNDVGIFQQLLINSNGCDSLIITTIAYSASDTTAIYGTSCDINDVGIFQQLLINSNGCDSLIITTIAYSAADTTAIFDTSCDINDVGIFEQLLVNSNGCDSLIITTIAYSAADTTALFDTSCDINDVGIFQQLLVNSNGCDSLIVTTIAYSASDTTAIFDTSCDLNDIGIFQQLLTNNNGCDSLIITTVTLLDADTAAIFGTSCNPASVGVFVQDLTNASGCDSTVVTTVAFSLSDTTLLTATTCDPAAAGVFVQGLTTPEGCDSTVITTVALMTGSSTFLASSTCDPTAAGVFVQNLTGQNGCDSTVTTTVSLLASSETFLMATTCDPNQAGTFVQTLVNVNGCDSTVMTTVSLLPSSETFLTGTTCDPTGAGVFVQNFTGQNGCDSTVTTTVALLSGSETFLDATSCDPSAAGIFVQNLTNQNGCDSTVTTTVALFLTDTTYSFSTTCDASQAGTTTVVYQNQSGCDSVAVAIATWMPPPTLAVTASDFGGFGVTCAGADDGWAWASATGLPPFQFAWGNGASSPLLDNLGAGVYALTATDANGCTSTATVTLTGPMPLANSLAVNALDCFDDNPTGAGGGAVTVAVSGGAPPYLYSLDGGPFQPSGTFGGLSAGAYEVVAQDANGCTATDLVAINAPVPLSVELGDDVFLELGDGTVLSALTNVPLDSLAQINWSGIGNLECPECPSQQVFPLVTTAYSVTVVDGQGCLSSDGLTVYVDRRKSVYVPNAFSPNGDGINDLLLVFAKEGQVKSIKSFQVFDRWGESVYQYFDFQPNDPATGWDGTHRGQLLDAAVFVWFAEVEFVDGEVRVFEGDVVLMK